jgi:TRAP-type mannitol/chloroaromatic compound transport system permease small subunit
VERTIERLGIAVAWATVLPLIAVSVYDIVARRVFNTGSMRLQELAWYLFLALIMLSQGYAYLREAHVRIDVVSDRFGPRPRAWIELAGTVFVLVPFCLLLIVYGGEYAMRAWMTGERSRADIGLPMRWLPKSTLPVGGVLLLLAGLIVALRNALFLAGRAAEPARDTAPRAA